MMNTIDLNQLTTIINEKSFFEDPLGWISRGVAQGISDFFSHIFSNAWNNVLAFLEATSDTFTLFAILILITAYALGVEKAKNHLGLVILFWICVQIFVK